VRITEWELISDEMHEDTRITKFQLSENPDTLTQWNNKFNLYLEVVSSHTALKLILTTENTNDEAIEISQALHTYFYVGDIEKIVIEGLQGKTYIDKLDSAILKTQANDLSIDDEIDRIYLTNTDLNLIDSSIDRKLSISGKGHSSWVIWNPWKLKSKDIKDLADDEYRNFICIEAANADKIISIPPNEEYKIETKISVD
jgi:glucose-6-phosphate 1-epimerase